jgi:hypothetical protein
VTTSRLFDLACGDFIRRYLPDPWIDAYEYWMKSGPEMPPAAPWAVKVDRILDYICKEHNDFMALLHYYAGSVEFQELYPTFLEDTRIKQIQQTLSHWYIARGGFVSNQFLVCMIHYGGCYPLPRHCKVTFDESIILVSTKHNYTKVLADPLNYPPAQCDARSYIPGSRKSRSPPTSSSQPRSLPSMEPATGMPGPFHSIEGISLLARPPSKRPHPAHGAHASRGTIAEWYATPEIEEYFYAACGRGVPLCGVWHERDRRNP